MDVVPVLKKLRKIYPGMTMLGSFTGSDPFKVLIATVLSARNRDEQTLKVVQKLFTIYKTPQDIAGAPIQHLEELVKQTGFYHVKAKRIKDLSQYLLDNFDGKVPDDFDTLVSLPGVGRKTAGCVAVYAFDQKAIPVDIHVFRISNRLGWVRTRTPEETEFALMKLVPKKYWNLVNEVLVLHGQNICKPVNPMCDVCPIRCDCRQVGV